MRALGIISVARVSRSATTKTHQLLLLVGFFPKTPLISIVISYHGSCGCDVPVTGAEDRTGAG